MYRTILPAQVTSVGVRDSPDFTSACCSDAFFLRRAGLLRGSRAWAVIPRTASSPS
uniref:AlNc14C278G10081 protein n=1 Tax=Albugo laibachii Nc14 TaxID=890382 RepID=F0WUT3_9STRA|nr:AlNc14C278G10081 [Albugo laibachii Nc14]|eukprot:CCA25169.1 AlNc14C278G10081 [Albugo laibachii Nc14]